jgi:Fe-S-cluster containining protein
MSNHGSICSHNCFGIKDHDGSCCHLEDRDWIIGPHTDPDDFLERLSDRFGREVKFENVFYTFEEGSALFPERSCWQKETSYPALKIDLEKDRKPCIFYNSTLRSCSIYDIRPQICRKYHCQYLWDTLHPVDEK